MEQVSEFERDLAWAINKNSRENGSNTPDFILAAYLVDCLRNFDRIMLWRQKWYSPEGVPEGERIHGPKEPLRILPMPIYPTPESRGKQEGQ